MADLINRQALIDAFDAIDWYHQNRCKDMISGANPDEQQAWYKADDVYKALEQLPSAEPFAQPEIIRCRDCKLWGAKGLCQIWDEYISNEYFYCGCAERRTDE